MDFLQHAHSKFKEFFASFKIIYAYVITDIEKKPRSFKIGVFSIFLVVCFLVILQSVLYLTPLIFIKLAEEQNGHYDLTITPIAAEDDDRSSEGFNIPVVRAVNFTSLQSELGDMPEIAGMSPRWLLPVRVANPNNPDRSFQAVSIILDSERERKYGIGKQLDVPDLKRQECWISSTVKRLLDLQGDEVTLSLDLLGALSKLETISINGEASFNENFITKMVKDYITANFGEGNLKIDFDRFGVDKNLVLTALIAIKTTLPLATRSDGTINFELLNSLLLLSGTIPQSLPLENLGNIQASAVINMINLAENFIENESLDVDPQAVADTAVPILLSALKLREDFTVTAVVDKPRGKWPEELGNVIIIDSNYVMDAVVESFIIALRAAKFQTANPALDLFLSSLVQAPQVEEYVLNGIGKVDISEYSLTVNVLLNNRPQIYASQESVRPHMINITNQIYEKLGRDHPTTVSSSIEIIMTGLFIFKNLLDNVFNATVFILLLLSILLIYSLMHSSVEEKTYEFGMLRALGMKQSSLIVLLGLQSLFFAIPGLILGMILAYAVNTIISYLIFDYTALATTYNFSTPALVTGISIALFVPLASNIIPIRRALSKTLKDSLNLYHRVISDMTVRILRLAQLGISPAQTVGALTLIILGFITYYVAPYSFIFANLTLFFLIMTTVLMLLIIGFTIVLNLVQSPSERGILKLIMMFYPQDKVLEPVIVKNLAAHKNRNTKTSLMFSIALSFLIYSGTSFRLNSSLIVDQLKAGLGGDIVIKTVPFEKSSLKEADIRQALEQYKERFPKAIRGYGFASQPLSRQPEVPGGKLSNLAGIPTGRVEIISVDEEFLKASYDEYYLPYEHDMTIKNEPLLNSRKIDGVKSLYKKEGLEKVSEFDGYGITTNADTRKSPDLNNMIGEDEIRLMIPSGLALQLSTDVGTPALLQFDDRKFRAKIRSTAVKFPGFYFTGYRTLWKINVITSHEDYRYITDKIYSTGGNANRIQRFRDSLPPNITYGVPKHHLIVRLNPGVDTETRLNLFNMLQTMVDGQFSFVLDVAGTAISMQESLVFIDIFFVLVSIIAISLSFFFTIVSFVSNISESSWEFGILRAVGLNKKQMTKVYIFEALSIIVAAGILGTIVGIIVALTTTIQFNLFTELPFRFLFPVFVFLFTLTLSVLTAVFGSKSAVDDIKNRQIASIIKSLD